MNLNPDVEKEDPTEKKIEALETRQACLKRQLAGTEATIIYLQLRRQTELLSQLDLSISSDETSAPIVNGDAISQPIDEQSDSPTANEDSPATVHEKHAPSEKKVRRLKKRLVWLKDQQTWFKKQEVKTEAAISDMQRDLADPQEQPDSSAAKTGDGTLASTINGYTIGQPSTSK